MEMPPQNNNDVEVVEKMTPQEIKGIFMEKTGIKDPWAFDEISEKIDLAESKGKSNINLRLGTPNEASAAKSFFDSEEGKAFIKETFGVKVSGTDRAGNAVGVKFEKVI